MLCEGVTCSVSTSVMNVAPPNSDIDGIKKAMYLSLSQDITLVDWENESFNQYSYSEMRKTEETQPSLIHSDSETLLSKIGPHLAAWDRVPTHCSLPLSFSLQNILFSPLFSHWSCLRLACR